jgi:hypothetical protein
VIGVNEIMKLVGQLGMLGSVSTRQATTRGLVRCKCGFQAAKYHKLARHVRNVHGRHISRMKVRQVAWTEEVWHPPLGLTAISAFLQQREEQS